MRIQLLDEARPIDRRALADAMGDALKNCKRLGRGPTRMQLDEPSRLGVTLAERLRNLGRVPPVIATRGSSSCADTPP